MAHQSEIRKQVFDASVAKLQEKIGIEQHAIKEMQQMANEYGAPKDRYDGFRMQLLRKKDLMAEMLQKTINELETIQRIGLERENSAVGTGAMVITESQKLFIAVPLGKVEVDGENWQVISPSAPIINHLQGLHTGDTFDFVGKKHKILDVF